MAVASAAFASGFGLYEASAPTYALGGAVVGRAYDATANFYNPATLTDLTNITVTVGFMTEHPRGRMKVNDEAGYTMMNPGSFFLPAFHLAMPLPWDLSFGLGVMPEYGLGSTYDRNWPLSFNSTKTMVQSVTVNPNLSYKVTDRWSLGAGLRFLWFDFEQYSSPIAARLGGTDLRVRNRLKGDNGMEDFGYQVGTKYDVTERLAVGLVYKSETRVRVDGKSENKSISAPPTLMANPKLHSGPASAILHLPQSITGGFNWDVADDWHLGGAIAWTEWSSLDTLRFSLPGQTKPIRLRWEDTWRLSIAPSWDFAEDWSLLTSYTFETDCCGSQDSTMLPPSTRHMVSLGLVWRVNENLDLGLTYGIILMSGHDSDCTLRYTDLATLTERSEKYSYAAHRALSHAAGFTITCRF